MSPRALGTGTEEALGVGGRWGQVGAEGGDSWPSVEPHWNDEGETQ